MVKLSNFFENDDVNIVEEKGNIRVVEYLRDLSVTRDTAASEYFASKMNIRRRQVVIALQGDAYVISSGAMQWTAGSVTMASNVKGVGDLFSKAIASKVTKESAIKPRYQGTGYLTLEPTYKHILLEDISDWGNGLVIEDGMFLASQDSVVHKVISRSNLSSAALGGEGLFNLCLTGNGIAVLESRVPREELITIELENDEVRIDGSYAVAWSQSLNFSVEMSSKSMFGSAVSGEGFVNVYRGTGKILMAPL